MRERPPVCTGTSMRAVGTFLIEENKLVVTRYCEIVWKTWHATRDKGSRLMRSDRRPGCLAVFSKTRCGVPCCICCCPCFPRAGPVGHGASLTDATGPYLRPVHPRWGNFGLLGVQRLQARGQKSPRRSVRPDLTLWTGSRAGTDLVVKPMFPNISVASKEKTRPRARLGS